MRKLFLLSFCCYFLLNAHSKTNVSTKFYKNEISAFAGFVSWEQSFAIVGEGLFNFKKIVDPSYTVTIKMIHPVGVSYKHYFTKMWTITSSFSYARTIQNHVYTNPIYSFNKYADIYSLMVGAECHYLNKKWVSLYSGLSIGGFIWQERLDNKDGTSKSLDGFLAFQLTGIGVRVGKRFGGFLELGFGNSGIINGGLSVKF